MPDKFVHEGPDHWLTKVIQEYLDALSKNFESGFRKLMSIDSMTGRQLLLDDRAPAASRTRIVIDNLDLGPGNEDKYCLIEGGTAKLTDAMVAEIAAGHGAVRPDRARSAAPHTLWTGRGRLGGRSR